MLNFDLSVPMIEDIRRVELDCLLKEIESLQSEMDMRLDRHANAFYICITLLAGVIAGVAAAIGKDVPTETVLAILVFIPWLTTPLAAMFFDDELLRGITEVHIHSVIAPRIKELLSEAGGETESIFSSSLGDRIMSLKDLSITDPRSAANTRRLLFAIPFVVAFGSFLFLYSLLYSRNFDASAYVFMALMLGTVIDLYLGMRVWDMWEKARDLWRLIEDDPLAKGDKRLEKRLEKQRASRKQA